MSRSVPLTKRCTRVKTLTVVICCVAVCIFWHSLALSSGLARRSDGRGSTPRILKSGGPVPGWRGVDLTGTVKQVMVDPESPYPPGCPPLSHASLSIVANQRPVLLTSGTREVVEVLGGNWMDHCNALNLTNYVMAAEDEAAASYLSQHHSGHCFSQYDGGMKVSQHKTGPRFSGNSIKAIVGVLTAGYDVIYSSPEVVWLRDPQEYYLNNKALDSADVILLERRSGDQGLHMDSGPSVDVSSVFFRNSAGGRWVAEQWSTLARRGRDNVEQAVLDWIRSQSLHSVRGSSEGLWTLNKAKVPAVLGVVPQSLVVEGLDLQTRAWQSVDRPEKALCARFSSFEGSTEAVRHQMREAGLFRDPLTYYGHWEDDRNRTDVRLMSIKLSVDTSKAMARLTEQHPQGVDPEALVKQVHTTIMEMQLQEVYAAMALAILLERTLVLPQMSCLCIRSESTACRTMTGSPPSPVPCPLDTVFNVSALVHELMLLHNKEMRLSFRESTFPVDPRVPTFMTAGRMNISASDQLSCQESPCMDLKATVHQTGDEGTGVASVVIVSPDLMETDLVALLEPFQQHPWLHFDNPQALFKGFRYRQDQVHYSLWFRSLIVRGCCLDDGQQGTGPLQSGHLKYGPLQPR